MSALNPFREEALVRTIRRPYVLSDWYRNPQLNPHDTYEDHKSSDAREQLLYPFSHRIRNGQPYDVRGGDAYTYRAYHGSTSHSSQLAFGLSVRLNAARERYGDSHPLVEYWEAMQANFNREPQEVPTTWTPN